MIPPPFQPNQGQWGYYPTVPSAQMPVLSIGAASCNELGYAIGVMKLKAGHPNLYCASVPGPWLFSTTVRQAVKDLQNFFGQYPSGVMDAAYWDAVRICALA